MPGKPRTKINGFAEIACSRRWVRISWKPTLFAFILKSFGEPVLWSFERETLSISLSGRTEDSETTNYDTLETEKNGTIQVR